jgi:hypothetical protein
MFFWGLVEVDANFVSAIEANKLGPIKASRQIELDSIQIQR